MSHSTLTPARAGSSPALRVLHSFPHRLGMSRICTTAWYEIDSVAEAGAEMRVLAGDSVRPFRRSNVHVGTTLAWKRLRLPHRVLGTYRTCVLHDHLVARRLPALAGQVDVIHAWPVGSLETIRAARQLGIPVALERCNAHTRFAYEVVRAECDRIGVPLPPDHEHAFNSRILEREEEEYALADSILCPSEFVRQTFLEAGFDPGKLVRFIYGVDEKLYYPDPAHRPGPGLRMIYVGVCAVRKGLHFALEAWLRSPACEKGEFLIAGGFLPDYQEKLAPMLAHPSVRVLGHRHDVPELMRGCDVFVLPSLEEGFGLVCTEAMASGCVPLVSSACTDLCHHDVNSLVHEPADVVALASHITALDRDRERLSRLRTRGLEDVPSLNWSAAGRSLVGAYEQTRRVAALSATAQTRAGV
jgi:glycosyltransferase involved in cell wall biosynthesis